MTGTVGDIPLCKYAGQRVITKFVTLDAWNPCSALNILTRWCIQAVNKYRKLYKRSLFQSGTLRAPAIYIYQVLAQKFTIRNLRNKIPYLNQKKRLCEKNRVYFPQKKNRVYFPRRIKNFPLKSSIEKF